MKKVFIFLAIIIVLFAGVSILTKMQNNEKVAENNNNPYKKDNLHPETVSLLEDKNYQNIILPGELDKKLKAKEDVTVYFFQSTCGYCLEATPVLSTITKEMGIDLVQFNLLEFEQGWDKYHIEETPTIVQYKKGKETARISALQEEDVYREWFKQNSK